MVAVRLPIVFLGAFLLAGACTSESSSQPFHDASMSVVLSLADGGGAAIVSEADPAGTRIVPARLTLTKLPGQTVRVELVFIGDTDRILPLTQTVTIRPYDVDEDHSVVFNLLQVVDNDVDEPDGAVSIGIGAVQNARPTGNLITIVILDDDDDVPVAPKPMASG